MDERRDSGEFYPGGDRRGGDPIDLTFDDAVTPTSARAVKSSGIWAAIWGALAALPAGVASLYDWCVAQLKAKQNALSAQQLAAANSGATTAKVATWDGYAAQIAAKASAADLRYAIVVAPVATTYSVPDSWFPITFERNGTSYTVPLADKDMIVVNDGYLECRPEEGVIVSLAYFVDAVLNAISPDVLPSLQFAGVAPVVGETALNATTTATLADRASNVVTTAATLTLPAAVPGHLRDLIVDVDNSAGASDLGLELASDATAYLDVGGARYLVAVSDGDDLADLLTVAAGKRARLYFAETAQTATPTGGEAAVPVISLQRLTVVVGGAA